MTAILLRDAGPADFDRILALNRREQQQTSLLDLARLAYLHGLAAHHRVAESGGEVVAFLIGMYEGADYDSENYRWFAQRYRRLAYVDRIVVDPGFAGQGIARRLYEEFFARAAGRGCELVACEYNLQPPNPASRAFHDRLGFAEVGQQRLAGGSKLVSLQTRALSSSPPAAASPCNRSPA